MSSSVRRHGGSAAVSDTLDPKENLAYVESEREHFAQVARETFQELQAITAERDRYLAQLRDALTPDHASTDPRSVVISTLQIIRFGMDETHRLAMEAMADEIAKMDPVDATCALCGYYECEGACPLGGFRGGA